MGESEETINELESVFPALAGIVFAAARKEALDAGFSVLQSEEGIIYEVFPDGRRIERLRVDRPTYVPAGTRVTIR